MNESARASLPPLVRARVQAKRRSGTLLIPMMFLILSGSISAGAEDPSGLTIADLVSYRAALEGKPAGTAVAVTFRELWDHPDRYEGRRIRVEGRIARQFRQAAFGAFPPLVEAWAVTPVGDPFCLVYRAAQTQMDRDAIPGSQIHFEGTYLRRVKYQGGDVARLAPLIVGDRPPVVAEAAPKPNPAARHLPEGIRDHGWLDWTIGLVAALFVALILARHHMIAPSRRPLRRDPDLEPPPEFVDNM